jgi:hypothetical protein
MECYCYADVKHEQEAFQHKLFFMIGDVENYLLVLTMSVEVLNPITRILVQTDTF